MGPAKDENFFEFEKKTNEKFYARRLLIHLLFAAIILVSIFILMSLLSQNAQAAYGLSVDVQPPKDNFLNGSTNPQTGFYIVNVSNLGTSEENVNLTITFNDLAKPIAGWTVNPSFYTVNSLAPGVIVQVIVQVTAPVDEPAFSWAELTVEGEIQEDPSITVADTFIARVAAVYDVSITVLDGDSAKSVNEGGMVSYNLTINNTGNADDTIDLSASGLPPGWSVFFTPDSNTIPSGGSFPSTMMLMLPPSVQGIVYPINAVATSQGDPSITDSTTTFTTVNPVYSLSISVSPLSVQQGFPGNNINYIMTVTNLGNADDTVKPGMEKLEGLTWSTFLDPGVQVIPYQSSKNWTLTVSIPSDAKDWENGKVKLNATSLNDPSAYDERQTQTNVAAVYGINVFIADLTNSTDPGSSVSYQVQITNIGNTNDTISLSTSGAFPGSVTPNQLFDLAPDTSTNVTLEIDVPSDALAGFYYNTITALSEDLITKDNETVTIEVNQIYDFTLNPNGPSLKTGVPGGGAVTYQFRVMNYGNGEDTIFLSFEGEKQSWADLESYLVVVPAYDYVIVNMTVTVPLGEPIDIWDIIVNGSSLGPNIWDTITFQISVVQYFGVSISTGDSANSVAAGESTDYYLVVENTGSGYDDFTVSYWAEDSSASSWISISDSFLVLAPGANTTVTMTVDVPSWATPGLYHIWFNVTSINDSTAKDSLETITEVTHTYSVLILSGSEQTGEALPKTLISYQVEILNNGTDVDSFIVEKIGKPTSNHPSWSMISHNFIQDLPAGESFTLFVNISIPEDTGGDTTDYLKIIIKSEGDPSVPPAQAYVWLNTTILPVRDAQLTPQTDIFYRNPGDVIIVKLQLTNTGTDTDTLTVEDATPPPYDLWGLVDPPATVVLEAGNSTNMTYNITIDHDATKAESPIKLNLVVRSLGAGDTPVEYQNITIFINQTYGVRISTTQNEKTGDPREEISFLIKVENVGNDLDTFDFTDFGPELGVWSHTDYDLGPGEFVFVYYNITIDSEHDTSDILITLNASSVGDPSGLTYDNLDITIHVNPRYGVKLGVDGSKYKEVYGGKITTFNLTIQNKGTTTDKFNIEPLELIDFEILSSIPTVTLNPEQKITVVITGTPREGTDIGIYNITINVTSQNDSATSQEYTFYADVQPTYDLFLSLTTTFYEVAPGEAIYITSLMVKNEGNAVDSYEIIIDLPPGWTYSLIYGGTLPPGETETIDLEIYPPPNAKAGIYRINITVRSVNDPTKEMTISLIVEVEQAYDILLTATTTTKTGDVGETLSYFIQVKNTGNGADKVELRLTGEHPEFAILYYDATENGQIIHISPPSGGSLGVYLNVSIPSNYWNIETQNQFTLTVDAESLDDLSIPPASDFKDFITIVNPVYGVDIISGGMISGEPGESLSLLFDVRNTGTVTDSYSIGVISVSTATGGDTSLWYPEISFNPTSISNLAKGAMAMVRMYVDIPYPANLFFVPPGIYNITAEVTSTSDVTAKDTQVFKVNVLQLYWADVQDIVIPQDVNIGESIQYTITIKNVGNGYDMFSVELEGDFDIPGSVNWGKLSHIGTGQIDQQSLVDIPLNAGQSTDIILTITIPQRTDPEYPAIDPDDVTLTVIVEPSDENGIDDQVAVTSEINIIYEFDFHFLANTLSVLPGDPAEFTMNIENKGTATETFTYEIYQWDEDWSAYGYAFFPSSGNLQVGAGNIGEVTLTINTPSSLDEAESRDYNITIRVHSLNGNANVFKNCTVHIEPVYDVDLTPPANTTKTSDIGSSVTYQFTVRNIGNTPESFQFTVQDLDTSPGGGGDQSSWATIYSSDAPSTPVTSAFLYNGESKSMILEIVIPGQGDPGFVVLTAPLEIEVEVYSVQDLSANDFLTTSTTINPIYAFELTSTSPFNTKEGEPGETVSFTLQVRNSGTGTDTYKFRVTSVDVAIFTPGTINDIINLGVDSYGTTTATITITDEKDKALVGTFLIEITAESDNDTNVRHTIILYIEITALAEVELIPASQTDLGEPGDEIDYVIRITNKGNAQDTFYLTLNGTYKDWGEIYDLSGSTQITQVTLNAASTIGCFTDIILRVTIPSTGETTAGQSYPITIKAASMTTEGVQDTAQVTTTIEEYVYLALEYSGTGPAFVDYDPNKTPPKFSFKVTNYGNIDETAVTVNIDDMPTIWGSPTIDTIDILEPGKSATFSITFDIPSDEDEGKYDILISVTSSDGSFDSNIVSITVNITKPDLMVDDVTGLDDLSYLKGKVGNTITVTARIANIGHTEAESVQVKFYEDEDLKDTKTITSIPPDGYKNVDFRWTVVAEEVEMKIEVTPLEEIDDGNNAISPIYLDLRPDLSFGGEQINFSTTNPAPNDEITITAFINNDGGNAEDVAVKFYYGTKVIGTDTLDIDYQETGEASVLWEVPDTPGETLTVIAEIDLPGAIGDGDETSKSIKVGEKPYVPEPGPELEAIGQLVAFEGKSFTYKVIVTKVEPGVNLTFSDDTDLFDINPKTGEIIFKPTGVDVGTHDVTITVTDDKGRSDEIGVKFRILGEEDEKPEDFTWILFVIIAALVAFIIGYVLRGGGKERLPEEREEYPKSEESTMEEEGWAPREESNREFKIPPPYPPSETPEPDSLPPSPPPEEPPSSPPIEEETFEFEKEEEE